MLTVRRCEQIGNTYVYTNSLSGRFKRLRLDLTGKAGIPLPRLASDAYRLDLAFDGPMPAHRHPSDTRQLQAQTVQTEPVAILFEPKRVEPIPTAEPRIARLFTRLDPAKEGLKCLVEIGCHSLQDVTVYLPSIGVFLAVGFDLRQLLEVLSSDLLS